MKRFGLKTSPDFNYVWIDSEISFVQELPEPDEDTSASVTNTVASDSQPELATSTIDDRELLKDAVFVGGAIDDPTYSVGKLDAANKTVLAVSPNHSLEQAVTLMLSHNFSQLPVMQGERDVKGVITWEGIGARLAVGKTGREVREFMSTPQVVTSEKSLFVAVEVIAQHQYVLVQKPDRTISGIITATDLTRQFQQLTEPFLLLGEVEQHVRKLIGGRFTPHELKCACDPADSGRPVETVADLTVGEYIRLLENPQNWEKLGLRIDRAIFIERLKNIGRIRNEVMHFDPDPPSTEDLGSLRQFVAFMHSLAELDALGASPTAK
jgi:CBS domain-containing protein